MHEKYLTQQISSVASPEETVMKQLIRESICESRKRRYINIMRKAASIGVNFMCLNREEIDKFFFSLSASCYQDETKSTEWKMFKKICRILGCSDEMLKGYKITVREKTVDVLTEKEIEAIVNSSEDPKYKVLFGVLSESGCRIGELRSVTKKNLSFDDKGCVISVNGKTGPRRVRIVKNADDLKFYVHFVGESKKLFDVTNEAILKMLRKTAKRMGITKRVYPHLFRHTRATQLSKFLTDREMCLYFGWSKSSDMPGRYSHLSMRDVDEKILAISAKV